MAQVGDTLLLATAVVLLIPLTVLTLECLAALLPVRRTPFDPAAPRPACAVLMPAHDEEAGIADTIARLRPRLGPADRLLVVADNCTDRTAELARAAGAEVLERADAARRGKGFALDFGLRHLSRNPPAVVAILDADCELPGDSLERLARAAALFCRPAVAVNLMNPPPDARPQQRVSAFAFQLKNEVRSRGLARLGLPCGLTGTGVAFPWAVLAPVRLASGNVTEDIQLGVELALAGRPARFCPEARVESAPPPTAQGARAQRRRWEHGHLRTLQTQSPRLMFAAVRRGRIDLAALAFDLSVPPLSLLAALWLAAVGLALAWRLAFDGSGWPAVLLLAGGSAAGLAVFAAWAKFGRERLPPRALLAAPAYALAKLPMYLAFLVSPQRQWVRAERGTDRPTASG
jgi:cellulose synthase/poly-beta-1,6-N-acetylglucosamine synthase-like glycosyltransferase